MSTAGQVMGPHGRPAEILLVEDNYGDILLTKEAFKSSRIANNIVVATDGEMALQMVRRQPPFETQKRPDLILLDLNLPKRDGSEVLESIKSDPSLCKIPVVILTGSRAEAEVSRSYSLHVNAYIAKPVNLEGLREIVAAVGEFWFTVVVLPGDSTEVR